MNEKNEFLSTSGQTIDVFKYAKKTSLILNITILFNFVFALLAVAGAWLIFQNFDKPPMIVQQDRGYLEPYEAGLFTLKTEHVQAFLEHVLGKLRSYDLDQPDYSPIQDLVDELILVNVKKDAEGHLEAARKFNRHQLWKLKAFRRHFGSSFASKGIVLTVIGEVTNYENSKIGSKVSTVETEQSRDDLKVFLVRAPLSKKNPYGLVLAALEEEKEDSKFEVVWKESIDPYASEYKNEFSWATSWRPRKRQDLTNK